MKEDMKKKEKNEGEKKIITQKPIQIPGKMKFVISLAMVMPCVYSQVEARRTPVHSCFNSLR